MTGLKEKKKMLYIKAEVEVMHDNKLIILKFRMLSESENNVKMDLYKLYGVEPTITSVRSMLDGIILHDLALRSLRINSN